MKILKTFALVLFFIKIGFTQLPCLPAAGGSPASNTPSSCFMCDSTYTGSTMGYTRYGLPASSLPCGTIENDQFLSVVVNSDGRLEATIQASNCQNNQGVQLIILDLSYTPISNCFSSEGIDFQGSVVAENLTPGDVYLILIDGMLGDICDFSVSISGGIDPVPPDPPGVMMIDPDTTPLCPGAVVCYSISPVANANYYEWIIPGNATIISGGEPSDTIVCLEYTAPGGGVVQVTPSNNCFSGVPAIEPVVALPILPTLLPPIFLCNPTGNLDTCYQTALGCDSCVRQAIIPTAPISLFLDVVVCSSECFPLGDSCYLTPGIYFATLKSNNLQECDTTVFLSIIAEEITEVMDTSICPGDFIQIDSMIFDSTISTDILYPQSTFNNCDSTLRLNLIISDLSAPDIICSLDSFTNSIAIDWTEPAGALGYELFVNDSLISTQNHSSFLYSPNVNEDSLKIRIAPFNSKNCAFKIAETTCFPPNTTSTTNQFNENQVKIFPNPTTGIIEIKSSKTIQKIAIFDLAGRFLFESFDSKIDLSNFDSGLYFLKIKTARGISIKKTIKL